MNDAALAVVRERFSGQLAWMVGGAVRDRLLGRDTGDLDLAVPGDTAVHARALAGACGGTAFPLSERHAAWRVVARDRRWHIDLVPLAGTIEDDLARRDFTINAIAEPLDDGPVVDPYGGRADLRAGRLRMVGAQAFVDDPLRALRAVRLACELGLEVEAATRAAAREHAAGLSAVSGERVFAELRQTVGGPDPVRGLELMEELGVLVAVLPEIADLRGVTQSDYHHLDVHEHTVAVLREVVALQRDPSSAFGDRAEAVSTLLAEPLGDEMTRGDALRFGALLHDAAKPQTREVQANGRVTFIGHDDAGAALARAALGRLRASERVRAHVAALTRHHLRLGFLVRERPLSRRAVYDYLKACSPVEVDVTVLSVADRLATQGRRAERAVPAHLELARELLGAALRWRACGPPQPLVRGDDLARRLGIDPGRRLGDLLAELEAAQFAGEVSTAEEAVAWAREGGSVAGLSWRPGGRAMLPPVPDPDCLFCRIVAGDMPARIVDEDERTVSFMDINPGTRGHALVIPREHAADLHDIGAEDLAACTLAAQRLAARARDRLDADGVNLLNACGSAAWQTVFHFHIHMVPRYHDDPLKLPWTPAPGDDDEIEAAAQALRD